ncbi:MAG: GNAT family N-acetyltransferase [Anaerolineaceae bacterium]|nr:GNAT family N-acetyltransferase [Anaerolineaceae bacterium]
MPDYTVRTLEEITLNAWPSLKTRYYDGWVVRFADGYTRRANSVNPLYLSSLDIHSKIQTCEAIYSERGLNTVFKLTPQVCPDDLDATLDSLGYKLDAPTSVQTMALDTLDPPTGTNARLSLQYTDAWLDAFCWMNSVPEQHHATMTRLLDHIAPRTAYAMLLDGERVAAVGLAVADGGYVGLFDIVVAPELRGRGLGEQLVLYLLDWGRAAGAHTGYLQVMLNNAPALRLYERVGFREVYRYWYRVKRR